MKARARVLRRALKDLLDTVADRLPEDHRERIHQWWFVGEWRLSMDWLVSVLVTDRVPLSPAERDQVAAALTEFGTGRGQTPFLEDPSGVLATLTVIDEHGQQLSPKGDFDPARWPPLRRLARAKYGRTGGHLAEGPAEQTATPHRTVFPLTWDAEKVDTLVLDVARNPDEVPEQTRSGGWLTRGTREDVLIEARLRPDGPILAGYPLSGSGVQHLGVIETPPPPPVELTPAGTRRFVPSRAEKIGGWRAELDALHADCVKLIDMLAPRLPDSDGRRVSNGLHIGELIYLAEDLLATLVQERISIAVDERAHLVATLDRLGLGDEDSPFLRDRDTHLAAIVVT